MAPLSLLETLHAVAYCVDWGTPCCADDADRATRHEAAQKGRHRQHWQRRGHRCAVRAPVCSVRRHKGELLLPDGHQPHAAQFVPREVVTPASQASAVTQESTMSPWLGQGHGCSRWQGNSMQLYCILYMQWYLLTEGGGSEVIS